MFGGFTENTYFCSNFLKPEEMKINHRMRKLFFTVAFMVVVLLSSAQNPVCKDTAEHRRLQTAMWEACSQDSQMVVYDACLAFQKHAKEDGDYSAANTAWICGIMFNLGQMNIKDAYHLVRIMKADIDTIKASEDERYLVPNMMGHVYNTCGNIPGAQKELQEAAKLIKGTRFEADDLPFIYLALAHSQLNNDVKEALRWVDEALKATESYPESSNHYRAKADAYALKAIASFKQHDYRRFRQGIAQMEEAEAKNVTPSSDLFLPCARIYQTLLDGNTEKALEETEKLMNRKEQYLLKCDIYHYIGDNRKAFLMQRELMHMRDSITGVMIDENIHQFDEEMALMKNQQQMSRRTYLILVHTIFLAILVIILLVRMILMRRRSREKLLAKNAELEEATRKVMEADEMKNIFMRSVSHEIRTPLNIINGFSQVLTDEDNALEADERRVIAERISTSTFQITSLVNKMLGLANESTKDLLKEAEDTDALKVCQEALRSMPSIDQEKIKVEFKDLTHGRGTTLCTHSDSLLQMLEELLENSVKFTTEGFIRLTLRNDGRMMWFTVEDSGCGIPEDKISTIFDRFTKVDEFTEGLGLGLAYCHEIAAKLGGDLRLDRTSDQGTNFTLGLPLKNEN